MKTSLVFLRHAEVEPRFHRIFGGRLDMGLSDLGHDQASRLASWLKRFSFDAILMQRTPLSFSAW